MAKLAEWKSPLIKGLKVLGYLLISVLVSEAVVRALQSFLSVKISDEALRVLINVILVMIATEIRNKLPKDNKLQKII